jgi:hypothetical protein
MRKREQVEAEDMSSSFFKHVLVNFLVIMFMLMLLWMTMA